MQLWVIRHQINGISSNDLEEVNVSGKGVTTMDNYIFFEEGLWMLVYAFLLSSVGLIAVSGIGLAVIETIERTNSR